MILCVFCFDKKDGLPWGILVREKIEDILSFGDNWEGLSGFTWLLVAEIRPRFWLCCYNASILYVCDIYLSKSRADFHYLWEEYFDPFLYLPQRLLSLSLCYFITIIPTSGIVSSCVLDFSVLDSSFSSTSEYFFSSTSKPLLFTFLFQYKVSDLSLVLLVMLLLSSG